MTQPQDPNDPGYNPGALLAPNPDQVNDFHRYDDSDNAPESHHHTLGIEANQASPGTHKHDGKDSADLPAYRMPTGSIVMHGGAATPTGWLLCDGTAVNRVTYATLYAAIGSAFGNGDGVNTFNLPDFRGRNPRGVNGGSPALAVSGGSSAGHTHTTGDLALSTAQLASHTHTEASHTHGDDHNHAGPSHTHTEGSHSHTEGSHSHGDDHNHQGSGHSHSEGSHSHSEGSHQHGLAGGGVKARRSSVAGSSGNAGLASSVNNQGSASDDIAVTGNTDFGVGGGTGSGAGGGTGSSSESVNFKSTQGYGTTTSASNGAGTGSNAGSGTGAAGTGATNNKSTQGFGTTTSAGNGAGTGAAGSGSVHNHGNTGSDATLDPWLAVNFIIKT